MYVLCCSDVEYIIYTYICDGVVQSGGSDTLLR